MISKIIQYLQNPDREMAQEWKRASMIEELHILCLRTFTWPWHLFYIHYITRVL